MVNATTGAAFTGTVTVYVTVDGGTQALGATGSGVCVHEGNGYHSYTPTATETDGALIAFTFIGTGAIPATIQVATVTESDDTVAAATSDGTAAGNLAAAKDRIAALIYDLTENPKPTYSVGGQSVSWGDYLNMLITQLENLDKAIQRANSPFQVSHRGRF